MSPARHWVRIGAWIATALGLLTLVSAGLLGWPLAGLTLALTVVAGLVSGQVGAQTARALRLVGLGFAGVVLVVALGGGMANHGLADLGQSLALALCALIVGQAMAQRSRHDQLVALLLAGLGPVLAAGLAPSPRVVVPALLAWLTIMTTLAVAQVLPADLGSDAAPATASDDTTMARPPEVHPGPGWWVPVAAVVAISTAFGMLLFLLVPRPQGIAVLAGDTTSDTVTPPRGVANYSGQQTMDLRTQGSLPSDTLFVVPSGAASLWRSTVLTAYADGVWAALSDSQGASLGSGTVSVPGTAVDVGTPTRPRRTDEVTVLPPAVADFGTPPVIAPGRVVAVQSDGQVDRQAGGGLAVQPPDQDRFSYNVTSVVQPDVATAVPSGDVAWAEPDPRLWLQLPWNLPQRVVDLGHQLVDDQPTRPAAVAAVEDYLRSHEQYELSAPVAPSNVDPVDYFLFQSHRGFCEHFASAEAVLLRAAGIPARVVTGFATGTQPEDRLPDGRQVIRANEAHAWVEVWLPGVGWASSDPTAGAPQAQPAFDPLGAAGRWLQTLLLRPVQRYEVAALIALAAAGSALLAWVTRRRRRAAVPGDHRPATPRREPFAAFARLEHRLAAVGRGRQVSETPAELLDRLPAHAADPLAVVERASYAAQPPGAAEVAGAAAALDDLPVGQPRQQR